MLGYQEKNILSGTLLFSHPVMSDSLQPHGLQWARPPCPSLSPEVCSSSCLLYRWCHPAISSSDALFSFCHQSFPASGTFPMNRLFESDDRNIGASASASALPMSIQGWFPLILSGLISLLSKGLLQHHISKASILRHSAFFMVQFSQAYMTIGKTIALAIWTFVGRVMSLLFNILSRFVIAFLLRGNRLLIPWLQSPSAVLLEPKKRKSVTSSPFPLLFAMK